MTQQSAVTTIEGEGKRTMIVKILGGNDEVIGSEGGPFARVLWMKFQVINEQEGKLVFSSVFSNANIKPLIRYLLMCRATYRLALSKVNAHRNQGVQEP